MILIINEATVASTTPKTLAITITFTEHSFPHLQTHIYEDPGQTPYCIAHCLPILHCHHGCLVRISSSAVPTISLI